LRSVEIYEIYRENIAFAAVRSSFKKFRNDYDIKLCSRHPNEMKNNELEALLNKNSVQTLKEQLEVDELSHYLKAMRKIKSKEASL